MQKLFLFREKYILRFAVCSKYTVSTDVKFAWEEVLRNLDSDQEQEQEQEQEAETAQHHQLKQ